MQHSAVPRLDPYDGFCDSNLHINPVAKLALRLNSSSYGTDGFHVSWKAELLYKPSMTAQNAMDRVDVGGYWDRYCVTDAATLLRPAIGERYPDDNLWHFIQGNRVQTRGHPPRGLFDTPSDGPYSAEALYLYCLQAMIYLMHKQKDYLWPHGDYRLFVPVDDAHHLEIEYGELLTLKHYNGKVREYCEVFA